MDCCRNIVRQRQSKAEFSITYIWYLSQLQELFANLNGYNAWIDVDYFSRMVLPFTAETTGERAVSLEMMWRLFGCAAVAMPRGVSSGFVPSDVGSAQDQ